MLIPVQVREADKIEARKTLRLSDSLVVFN